MFERYLTEALTTHFGHVIENLDQDKARLSAWNGELALENLSLRKDALDSFVPNCPVEIAYGTIGNLELKIPWKIFRSQLRWRKNTGQPILLDGNCSVVLRQVNILIVPRSSSEQDETDTKEVANKSLEERRNEKEGFIQDQVDAALLRRVTLSSKPSSRWQWLRDYVATLLSTLSVTIKDIHIRYEDPGCCMGFRWNHDDRPSQISRFREPFSVGITLREMSYTTTDSSHLEKEDKKKYGQSQAGDCSIRHKRATATAIAIYWDSSCALIALRSRHAGASGIAMGVKEYANLAFQALNQAKATGFFDEEFFRRSHNYLLSPASPTLYLSLVSKKSTDDLVHTMSTESDDEISRHSEDSSIDGGFSPPSVLSLSLPLCLFTIGRNCLEDFSYLRKSVAVWKTSKEGRLSREAVQRLSRLRPRVSPIENPAAWWRYAFEAVLLLDHIGKPDGDHDLSASKARRRGWMGFLQAFRRRKVYLAAYDEILLSDMGVAAEKHEDLINLEDSLTSDEIVAFRLHFYEKLRSRLSAMKLGPALEVSSTTEKKNKVSRHPDRRLESPSLKRSGLDFRLASIREMVSIARREELNVRQSWKDQTAGTVFHSFADNREVPAWQICLACPDFSIQVDDETSVSNFVRGVGMWRKVPIARLSCAWLFRDCWYIDGSWDIDCSIGSLGLKDLKKGRGARGVLPFLIGRRRGQPDLRPNDTILIDRKSCWKSASVCVRRRLHWTRPDGKQLDNPSDRGSTTTTTIHLMPLEVVAASSPVDALSRVLGAIKTPELTDDYHRLSMLVGKWRERQRIKLLKALAHRHKTINVDIKVEASEILFPDNENIQNGSLLALDLGDLHVFREEGMVPTPEADDVWRLKVVDVTVTFASVNSFVREERLQRVVVEPFSLDFEIQTRFVDSTSIAAAMSPTQIRVDGILPHLAFNFSSSVIGFLRLLSNQWSQISEPASRPTVRRSGIQTMGPRQAEGESAVSTMGQSRVRRVVVFGFRSPVVSLCLIEDTEGSIEGISRNVLDLSFRALACSLTANKRVDSTSELKIAVTLHAVTALDLYQTAGVSYSYLVSSVSPALIAQQSIDDNLASRSSPLQNADGLAEEDLVRFVFESSHSSQDGRADKLSVRFHELFVEWNPETLAAIQRVLHAEHAESPPRIAIESGSDEDTFLPLDDRSDEEFFDAAEDQFFDAGSEADSIHLISEIAESGANLVDLDVDTSIETPLTTINTSYLSQSLGYAINPPSIFQDKQTGDTDADKSSSQRTFHASFQMSSLRVSFNKETRHRKLVVAQMNRTEVSYTRMMLGGSKTTMSIGNLALEDPSALQNKSLYGQILGLQTSFDDTNPTSLLEMEIIINKRERSHVDGRPSNQASSVSRKEAVTIDPRSGTVTGCNFYVNARFSPMRFVFLEQLWMEIMDYFFVGVIGNDVWSGKSKLQLPSRSFSGLSAAPSLGVADNGFNFTNFDVFLDSPNVLFPVTYRSSQYVKFSIDKLCIANFYNSRMLEDASIERRQWFNNLCAEMHGGEISSWCGRQLGKERFSTEITAVWPVGSLAYTIVPKWNVSCDIGNLDLTLRRQDYALFQHIISHNIGEVSRHVDEWEALQSLSVDELEDYKKNIHVHFGYDKKDVAPTTFLFGLRLPSLNFGLVEVHGDSEKVCATIRCDKLFWQMKKSEDRVSSQTLSCDVSISALGGVGLSVSSISKADFLTLLSLSDYSDERGHGDFLYTSTFRPTGDTVKTITISGGTIFMVAAGWKRFSMFFRNIPSPEIMTEAEVGSSIQVGDRWYKIGESNQLAPGVSPQPNRFSWILSSRAITDGSNVSVIQSRSTPGFPANSYQFRLLLVSPRIVFTSSLPGDNSAQIVLRMENLDFLHYNTPEREIVKNCFVHGMEVWTSADTSAEFPPARESEQASLISPWNVAIESRSTTNVLDEGNPCDSIKVSAEVLQASASYSDITRAVRVYLSILEDLKLPVEPKRGSFSASVHGREKAHVRRPTGAPLQSYPVNSRSKFEEIVCDGFEVTVIDDSGRHFARRQSLFLLVVGPWIVSRFSNPGASQANDIHEDVYVGLAGFDLIDCLQRANSAYRLVGSSRATAMPSPSDWQFRSNPSKQGQHMDWNSCCMKGDNEFGFRASAALSHRTQLLRSSLSVDPSIICHLGGKAWNMSEVVLMATRRRKIAVYRVTAHALWLQWNPSTVIALQRFLGRLRKDIYSRTALLEEQGMSRGGDDNAGGRSTPSFPPAEESKLDVRLDSFRLQMNKEHQDRKLLLMELQRFEMSLSSLSHGRIFSGTIGNILVDDCDDYKSKWGSSVDIHDRNRTVLKVAELDRDFVKFVFRTFDRKIEDFSASDMNSVPSWVNSRVHGVGDIDDLLVVSVASLRFVYISGRTLEILDYLSNGLPGKGMGVTSKAAKGFLSKRIVTKSFLDIRVEAPLVEIPRREDKLEGALIELGDLEARSWFENESKTSEAGSTWWRVLQLSVSGLDARTFQTSADSGAPGLRQVTRFPVNMGVLVRKPISEKLAMSLSAKISYVDVHIGYMDYCLIRSVFASNIGRKVDPASWDNIEKAYWEETTSEDQTLSTLREDDDREPTYSKNARFVRYGQTRNRKKLDPPENDGVKNSASTSFEGSLVFDGMSARLRRDDPIDGVGSVSQHQESFDYDMLLMKVQLVRISAKMMFSGLASFSLSLYRLAIFDLGDSGRLMRESYQNGLSLADSQYTSTAARLPCAFSVLAEGYSPDGQETDDSAPQIELVVEQRQIEEIMSALESVGFQSPHEGRTIDARLIVNFLSLNPLVRPIQEVLSFFHREWGTVYDVTDCDPKAASKSIVNTEADRSDKSVVGFSGVQLRLVANFPRVFLLADESDPHSRALVLRGLGVFDLTRATHLSETRVIEAATSERVLVLRAQLQRVESFINPDVHEALRLRRRHVDMIGEMSTSMSSFFAFNNGDQSDPSEDNLGVALIQPVSMEIEFSEYSKELYPTTRSCTVKMEPVATTFSFSDIELVETILQRWRSRRLHHMRPHNRSGWEDSSPAPLRDESGVDEYEVIFETRTLGLGLTSTGRSIIVSSIQNSAQSDILVGDTLLSIEGERKEGSTLEEIVLELSRRSRPLRLTFGRDTNRPDVQVHDGGTRLQMTDDTASQPIGSADQDVCRFVVLFSPSQSNGLSFRRSPCGDFPVVSTVSEDFLSAVIGPTYPSEDEDSQRTGTSGKLRTPRIGAAVIAINGQPVQRYGCVGALEELERICNTSETASVDTDECIAPSLEPYSVTFLELHSSLLGTIDSLEVRLDGLTLSFIDDLDGRDMPLMLFQLDALSTSVARGIGTETRVIEQSPPQFLYEYTVAHELTEESDEAFISRIQSGALLSDVVSVLNLFMSFDVQYHYPRIGAWEPLVESSQVYVLSEYQAGSLPADRPAQLAIELSDSILKDQSFLSEHAGIQKTEPGVLSINLSDAGVGVLAETGRQWKKWRELVKQQRYLFQDDATAPSGVLSSELIADGSPDVTNSTRDVAAAEEAVRAALEYARKRGAETSNQSQNAKPFKLRNRTGIAIAFVQSTAALLKQQDGRSEVLVGEYKGLELFKQTSVTELADGEDAEISMSRTTETNVNDGVSQSSLQEHDVSSTHVRNYDGLFPDLLVAVQSVAGVRVEALAGLNVNKVCSTVRYLEVAKDADEGFGVRTKYFVPVIWDVSVEENRRILTLSGAARIVPTCFDVSVEIGVQVNSSPQVSTIAISRSGDSFYLPLWLALRLQPVKVFVRPMVGLPMSSSWSDTPILEYKSLKEYTGRDVLRWSWEPSFGRSTSVSCTSQSFGVPTTWFSCYSNLSSPTRLVAGELGPVDSQSSQTKVVATNDRLLTIVVDSGLTIRNLLPVSIDWEVASSDRAADDDNGCANGDDVTLKVPVNAIDESNEKSTGSSGKGLLSGHCVEIFRSNFRQKNIFLRVKFPSDSHWSSWGEVRLGTIQIHNTKEDKQGKKEDEPQDSVGLAYEQPRYANIQIPDSSFGVPTAIGLRVMPKTAAEAVMPVPRFAVHGIEVTLYADLWIRNLSCVPLSFGCPNYQIQGPGQQGSSEDSGLVEESAAKFNAESTLMEIASVLEFGDNGIGLNNAARRKVAELGSLQSLPRQASSYSVEEVFEYVEIESSTVKRRWWGSEDFASYRRNITKLDDLRTTWRWVDEVWTIDTAGDVNVAAGAWESCRSLLGGAGGFSGTRSFDPTDKFRRRRWFRKRSTEFHEEHGRSRQDEIDGVHAFHQPLRLFRGGNDSSQEQKDGHRKDATNSHRASLKISTRIDGGRWSIPVEIPSSGPAHGTMRVFRSRWPLLTKLRKMGRETTLPVDISTPRDNETEHRLGLGCLDSSMLELCYIVADGEGEWGDCTRVMTVVPRFLARNDSKKFVIDLKQTGATDDHALSLLPGEAKAFHWADFRLPGLVSLRLGAMNSCDQHENCWSGGFDVCNLGMAPIRVRHAAAGGNGPAIRSLRALVEIRPGTGGFGYIVSFREEDSTGVGSLFRIENNCPFPIWFSQDGVLANPSTFKSGDSDGSRWKEGVLSSAGDLISPGQKMSYGLDVPYRQGKYAHRKPATMPELLRLRVALAPLGSRAGVETVKVIGLTVAGSTIRLNPSKMSSVFTAETRRDLDRIRIFGVISNDGPTRVLRFVLISKKPIENVFEVAFDDVRRVASKVDGFEEQNFEQAGQKSFEEAVQAAARIAIQKYQVNDIPSELEAKQQAAINDFDLTTRDDFNEDESGRGLDCVYTIRAALKGFLVSFVDSAPAEICTAILRDLNVLSRWNAKRTTDASAVVSIGWLQVDNHLPNSPFPVALRPDLKSETQEENDGVSDQTVTGTPPLLLVGLSFAPKHNSGIVCLRSVTIAPRNLAVAVDLALLVRLRQYVAGIQSHFHREHKANLSSTPETNRLETLDLEQRRAFDVPVFESVEAATKRAAAFGVGNIKMYFEGFTILPCNVSLSVAPARALTASQASLEGEAFAAIHQAVRKGDILVGKKKLLGVKVGSRNATALAVAQGVLKSIVVDALLRLDGASLNMEGVVLHNHIATGPQLVTYLAAHYLSSLRHNVPALLGSLAAFGNPVGLIRGVGEGMSDFVTKPVEGLQKSVQELDPGYLLDGVARGTESLARHTVGGFADSASLLTETFSKNMAVLTLDRKYAQKRDRGRSLHNEGGNITLAEGVESGFFKLIQGFRDGVFGVIKAPMRGAEKRGIEGFAKGIGKGLLGLLVKPMIGISDAATDVMIGVKSAVEQPYQNQSKKAMVQYRPRRPMYGRDKVLRPYRIADAAAATLMLRTRLAGENYLAHKDMGNRVALFSVGGMLLLGPQGQELFAVKYSHISGIEVRPIQQEDGRDGWGILILLSVPRRNGSTVEVICCDTQEEAMELSSALREGVEIVANNDSSNPRSDATIRYLE